MKTYIITFIDAAMFIRVIHVSSEFFTSRGYGAVSNMFYQLGCRLLEITDDEYRKVEPI